jgi:hypothetical protein
MATCRATVSGSPLPSSARPAIPEPIESGPEAKQMAEMDERFGGHLPTDLLSQESAKLRGERIRVGVNEEPVEGGGGPGHALLQKRPSGCRTE